MRQRFDTGRIEASGDGVFSGAATLLVVDLAVPAADFKDLSKGIVDRWPADLAFATSFLTVGSSACMGGPWRRQPLPWCRLTTDATGDRPALAWLQHPNDPTMDRSESKER